LPRRVGDSNSLKGWQVAAPYDSPVGCRKGSDACRPFVRPEGTLRSGGPGGNPSPSARSAPRHAGRPQLPRRVDPTTALMLASRVFLQCLALEVLFGVPVQLGQETPMTLKEISKILHRGFLRLEDSTKQTVPRPCHERL
jgi:hypothetical protein